MSITLTFNGKQFYSTLSRVALAACTDGSLPPLAAVQVTTHQGRAWLIASDRYRIHAESVELSPSEAQTEDGTTFYLPSTTAKDLRRFEWNTARDSGDIAHVAVCDDGSVTISSSCDELGTLTVRADAALRSFPKLASLMTKAMERVGAEDTDGSCISLHPAYLADLDKVRRMGPDKTASLVLDDGGHGQPVLAQLQDNTDFRALIMSIRLPEDLSDRHAVQTEAASTLKAALL